VIEIAEEEGIPVEEGTYAPDAVREADEVFLTNSTWEIRPVETVDGIAVDGDGEGVEGPLTALLAAVRSARGGAVLRRRAVIIRCRRRSGTDVFSDS